MYYGVSCNMIITILNSFITPFNEVLQAFTYAGQYFIITICNLIVGEQSLFKDLIDRLQVRECCTIICRVSS